MRTDSTFFDVFNFSFIHGSAGDALDQPDEIVLTESSALKHFGRTDVIGETITWYGDEENVFRISGIIEDVPENSHFKFDYLSRLTYDNIDDNWGWYNYYTYIRLENEANIDQVKPKLQPFYDAYMDENNRHRFNVIYSQALTDIHLKSNIKWELEANGNMNNVYLFVALGLFVLLISAINYLNLTVATSLQRLKEVGVRKVFGAHRRGLIVQFIVEAFVMILLAAFLGSLMAEFFFNTLGSVLGREISILDPVNLEAYLQITGAALVLGIIASLYPAIYLSSFSVSSAVKGIFKRSGKSVLGLRKVLLVVQFAIATFMLLGSIIVYKQLSFVKNADLGIDNEQVLVIENISAVSNQETLKTEMLKLAAVTEAGSSNAVIGGINWTFQIGYPDAFLMNYVICDPDLLETVGFEFVAGRNLSKEIESDASGFNFIVNETGLSELGLNLEDVGELRPMLSDNDSIINGTVVGVIKDFMFTDFKSEIKPFSFFYREGELSHLYLKVNTENMSQTIKDLETTWQEVAQAVPFEFFFLNDTYTALHAQEEKLSRIFLYLTGLAIFIAFVGMVAMTNITIKDRLKEIAIRKILGASTGNVTQYISRKFLVLVCISNIIAIPTGYLIMGNWLDSFAYRTNMPWTIFLLSMVLTLGIAWLTVGSQTLKAALSNPVESLRSD